MSNPAPEQTRPLAPSFDLTGKRVVVVGGKKGIGLGVTHEPPRHGRGRHRRQPPQCLG